MAVFLNDIGEEEAAGSQYGKAAQLDPEKSAAVEQPRQLLR